MSTAVFVFLHLTLTTVYCLQTKSLAGQWILGDAAGQYTNLKAMVPGGIYTDLMSNNIIGDVFYGSNDTATRWVAKNDWIYSQQFLVDDSILDHKHVNLVFEGLDTFALILVNNVTVGESENMFLRYVFDIRTAIQKGNNTIEVRFVSPIAMAESLASRQNYTIPPNCPPNEYNGECHVNQIRKMQASFSWDWGPAFPSTGIWKDVYIEAFNSSVIRYLLVDHDGTPQDSWLVTISTILSATNGDTITGKLVHVLNTDVSEIHEVQDVNSTNTDDSGEIQIDFVLAIPKLIVRRWWPNGYGEQKHYTLTTTFTNGVESSSKTTTIGFRTVELVQDNVTSGLSFYFKINGVSLFAKGANEIPLDVLPERGQDPITVDRILNSVQATNMNMLRVWGGGVYESDYFYQRTDELGIMIWQDFMFACAMYPSYPEFLKNVKAEVRHQVRRLMGHPSIVIWAGNNENEAALMGNWYNTQQNLSVYKQDYVELYINTIQSELRNITNRLIFVSSSPSNGLESVQEDYLASNPQNPLYGDVHFYNYLLNSLDAKTYPVPRFVSEFGYQSLPDVDSLLTATNNLSDLQPGSDFMNHRQHHPLGLVENTLLINYQLNINSTEDYKTYIFYSQIVQALSIKFETEYYRSFMGRLDEQGRGNAMGALFWQLNDVWVAPTWSSIDYTGKWKMLQYFAADFFAPSIVTGYLDVTRTLRIYAVTEFVSLFDSTLDCSVVIQVYNWSSFDSVASTTVNITLEYGKSLEVVAIDTDDYLSSLGCGALANARTNCFFFLTLTVGNTVIAPHNFILPTALKSANLINTDVKITLIKQLDDKNVKFEITVQADGISLFVWLDSHGIKGRFSENGFVQVDPSRKIVFEAEEQTSITDLEKVLTITHLNSGL